MTFSTDVDNKTKEITNNGHGESDQNSNVVQKIEDGEDKEFLLKLEVSSCTKKNL